MTTDLAVGKKWSFYPGTTRYWAIGPLELWVQRRDTEWAVAVRRGTSDPHACLIGEEQRVPDDLRRRRWSAREGERVLQVSPILPDRPVVVRPEAPITIQPGDEALFFMGIPFWLRLQAEGRLLCEEPIIILSKSWFGTPTEGSLCLAMRTTARRDPSGLEQTPFRAVCPLQIRNLSETPLLLERFCLDLSSLAVYQGRSRRWTNLGRLTYRGQDVLSRAAFGASAPPYDQAEFLIGDPRHTTRRRGGLFEAFETFTAHDRIDFGRP